MVNFIQAGIPIIFERIGCKLADFQTDLNVNESNMLQYMAIIENRTNEILLKYDQISAKVRFLKNLLYAKQLPKVEDDDQYKYQAPESQVSDEDQVKKQDNFESYQQFEEIIGEELCNLN